MEIENIETNPSLNQTVSASWTERNGFADWGMALIWIVIAFISFQLITLIVVVILVFVNAGTELQSAEFSEIVLQHMDSFFIGNSIGQILVFGVVTIFVTRLHLSKTSFSDFLRFKTHSNTLVMLGATALLIVAIQPVVWFLAWLNSFLPVPEYFETMQTEQMEMIQNYLQGDHLIWLTLFNIGIVPAVCEEIMYRGYVMRCFEKSWGIWVAILFSGFIFGAYHMQPTNLLPLATIGIVLAYVTWTSKSIYPAMLAHFINNGGSVLVATYQPDSAFAEMTPETVPPLWAVGVGLIVSAYLVYFMYQQYQKMPAGGEQYA